MTDTKNLDQTALTLKDQVIVFFGELSTKGKNIFDFIRLLGRNIKAKLKAYPQLTYQIHKDHIYIALNGVDYALVAEKLAAVPGIRAFAKVTAVDKNLDVMTAQALDLARQTTFKTFKVIVKRADKTYPMHSIDIERHIGSEILEQLPHLKVDVHHPELRLNIYLRPECAYVYGPKQAGLGGYPLGIAGKTLHLLSGGIDSPVAAYLMMKRGCRLECIHFAAPPYTSEKVIVKITDLLHLLNEYQPAIKLYIVPFTKLQLKIYEKSGSEYAITIMRRMMVKIAQQIAGEAKDIVLSTGESIGQVASQTLKSLSVINRVAEIPLIRPLATYDKTEIIALAQKIKTFDTSIRPYEDCCTIFPVKGAVTAPRLAEVERIEASFDYQALIDECVKETRKIWVDGNSESAVSI